MRIMFDQTVRIAIKDLSKFTAVVAVTRFTTLNTLPPQKKSEIRFFK